MLELRKLNEVKNFATENFTSNNGEIIIEKNDFNKFCQMQYFKNRETWLTDAEILSAYSNWYFLNKDNFSHLYETTKAEYNPIENYSSVETFEKTSTNDNKTITANAIENNSKTTDQGQTSNKDIDEKNLTTTDTSIETNTHKKYAFDAQGTPTNESGDNKEGTNTQKQSGTDTHTISGTNSNTNILSANEQSDGTTLDTGKNTEDYTLTKKGNIGVTTSQQMLESERDLWKYNIKFDIVSSFIRYISIVA